VGLEIEADLRQKGGVTLLHIKPAFVCDVHLGKLARHLRMVGFDTVWRDDLADPELLKISAEENRVLLTRDRALHELADPARRHYVQAIEPGRQLVETLTAFSLVERVRGGRDFLSRCMECNSLILPAKPHQVADRVPGELMLRHDRFYLCPRCERVYWEGSHFDRMRGWVKGLLG
jgi:uncharacterized protein